MIKGKVTGVVIGDGLTVTTVNGEIQSVNERSGEEWKRRLDQAFEICQSEELAQWYAALSPRHESDALEMFRQAYGRAPGEEQA
jgi:hypothetical protein